MSRKDLKVSEVLAFECGYDSAKTEIDELLNSILGQCEIQAGHKEPYLALSAIKELIYNFRRK